MPCSLSRILSAFLIFLLLWGLLWSPVSVEAAPAGESASTLLGPQAAAQLSTVPGRKLKPPKWMLEKLKTAGERLARALGEVAITEALKEIWETLNPAKEPDLASQLEELIPQLVERIKEETGPERQVLEDQLLQLQNQLTLVRDVQYFADAVHRAESDQQAAELTALREEQQLLLADQRELLQNVEALEQRIAGLEAEVAGLRGEVSDLSDRLATVEDALIASCLDLRSARRYGVEGYPVHEDRSGWLVDDYDSDSVRIDTRLMLNACTPDLTDRGLLLQFALTTYGLEEELRLYVTVKDLRTAGFDPTRVNAINRLEYPILFPQYPIDGVVQEIFLPYADLPLSSSEPLALAFVLTHDGAPVYSLPDQVVRCLPGRRMQCRWGR